MTAETFTVRVSCPDCGDVTVNRDDLIVLQCVDTRASSYAFTCPCCGVRTARDASQKVVLLLLQAGVRSRFWWLPAELFEPRPGGRLSFREVGEFNVWVESL